MGAIFFISSVPGDKLSSHMWDKLAHVLAYGVLGILFLLPLCGGRLLQMRGGTAAMAVLLATLYGAFDEVHQAFTPNLFAGTSAASPAVAGAAVAVAAILLLIAVARRLRGSVPVDDRG